MAMMGAMQTVHILNAVVYTETKLHDGRHDEETGSEGDKKLDSISTSTNSTVEPNKGEKLSDEEESIGSRQQDNLSTIQKLMELAKCPKVDCLSMTTPWFSIEYKT